MKKNEYKLLEAFIPEKNVSSVISQLLKGEKINGYNLQFPLKAKEIIIESQKDSSYSVYFKPDFKTVEKSLLENILPTVKIPYQLKNPEEEFNTLEEIINKIEKDIKFVDLEENGEFGAIIQILKRGKKYYFKFEDKK